MAAGFKLLIRPWNHSSVVGNIHTLKSFGDFWKNGMHTVGNGSWKDSEVGKRFVWKFFLSSSFYMADCSVGKFYVGKSFPTS